MPDPKDLSDEEQPDGIEHQGEGEDDAEGVEPEGSDGDGAEGSDEYGSDEVAEEGDEDRQDDLGDEPPARQSRGANRFQRLSNENRELKQRLDKLERGEVAPRGPSQAEIERMRAQQEQADTQELERAALEGGPAAAAAVARRQAQRDIQQHMQGFEYRLADRQDKADFKQLCREVPVYGKLADRVEEKLAEYRRNGANPPRENIAKFLIGEDAVKRAQGAATRQGKRGAARTQREQVQPRRGGRSDVAGARERRGDDSVEAFERRYGNTKI